MHAILRSLLSLPLLLLQQQNTKHFHGMLNTGACVGVRDKLNPLASLKQGMVIKAHQSLCEYDVVYKDGKREDLLPAHRCVLLIINSHTDYTFK